MVQIKRIFCFSIMSLVLLTVALPGRAQVPFISQPLVPTATAPGGPDFTLTVNGANFVSGSVVKWNGTALATTFVNSDQLTATVPAEEITSVGKGWITVTNPTPGGGTSNVAFCEIAAAGGEAVFSGNDYPVGTDEPVSEPESVAVGDFNGDGKLDLVTANYGSGTVTLLLGYGTKGAFSRPSSAPVSLFDPKVPTAWAVAVGDFNGDGKLDVAVGTNTGVSVLLGNGDGSFQTPVNYPTGGLVWAVAVGDFNGDGKLDVAVGTDTGVSVLLGNGDGTFQSPVANPVGGRGVSIAVADLNGDGKLDLAIATPTGASVLLGSGDGTLKSPVAYPVGGGGQSIAVADLNGDGKFDLVAGNANAVSALLGNGNGTFQSPVAYPVGAYSFAVLDFNGDGKLDIAIANKGDNSVSILAGNGDGTFTSTNAGALIGTSLIASKPTSIVAGDFDGSGYLGLVTANEGTNNVTVLWQSPPTAPAPSGGNAQLTGGNTFTGNQTVNGTVAATGFVGDGSGLTGVNAATVNNGVYTTGQYVDPSWITSLSGSKITGTVLSAATALTAQTATYALSLSGTPSQCGSNSFATGITPTGNANCLQPASVNLSDNANLVFNTQANIFIGGKQTLSPSDAKYASLNLPNTGATPSTLAVGDLWLTAADTHLMFLDKNNTTQSLAFLSDLTSGTSGLLSGTNTFTGNNTFAQTITGSITGNAGTVSNGVYTTTPYTDPAWITSLSASKIFGTVPSATTALTALSATTATSAYTATNASNLGGVPATSYARVDAGNTLTGNQTVTGNVNITGNAATSGSVTIGSGGTPIKEHLSMTFNPKFPALPPLTCSSQNFTYSGASDGDTLLLGVPSSRMNGGGTVVYTAWVSAANTVTIQVCNVFASPQKSAGTGAIRVDIWKH